MKGKIRPRPQIIEKHRVSERCKWNHKISYETLSEARRASKGLRKKLGPRTVAYRCPKFNHYHIGHRRKEGDIVDIQT